MDNNLCFSLYAVEARVGEHRTGVFGCPYHAFLVLRNESSGAPSKELMEMHFVMKTKGLAEGQKPYLHAITKICRDRDFSQLSVRGYVGGRADVMLPAWDKATKIGLEISDLEIPFSLNAGKEAVNCRAGVKAVIESLGLDYEPVLWGESVEKGTESRILDQIPPETLEDGQFL